MKKSISVASLNEDSDENKNHSPMAKRFILRRFSGSGSGSQDQCFSKKMVWLGTLLSTAIFLFFALPIRRITSVHGNGNKYLRIKRGRGWKPKPSTSSWPVPKVVVLPGPHMAETTDIQKCMVKWTMQNEKYLDNWLWAVPESSTLKKHNLISQGAVKNFSPLFGLLSGQKSFVFQQSHSALSQHAMKTYKEPMLEAWKKGHRIVYGSEEIDFATSDIESVDPDKILDGVFGILPWEDESRKLSKDDIEVVVLHKGSRIDHLIEIWQEVEFQGGSFREFLSERSDIFSTIDGLGLAKLFLERDVRVSIVDSSGRSPLDGASPAGLLICNQWGTSFHLY